MTQKTLYTINTFRKHPHTRACTHTYTSMHLRKYSFSRNKELVTYVKVEIRLRNFSSERERDIGYSHLQEAKDLVTYGKVEKRH